MAIKKVGSVTPPQLKEGEKTKPEQKVTDLFIKTTKNAVESPEAIKREWASLNSNDKVRSGVRDTLKIYSINRFVIAQARKLNLDPAQIRDVIFGLKGNYLSPKAYIAALSTYLPELREPLALLSTAAEINSRLNQKTQELPV